MKVRQHRKKPLENAEERFLRSLGRAIVEEAAKRNVSVERLAYEAGVSKGYLYDLMKGTGNPSILILHRIATALDIKTWQLVKI